MTKRTPEERLRAVAQILIAEIGADGPMDAEDAAAKAVQTNCNLRDWQEGVDRGHARSRAQAIAKAEACVKADRRQR